MEKSPAAAVRKPRSSTSDLLTWPEAPPSSSSFSTSTSAPRSRQPSDGIKKVLHGGQVTDDEAQSLLKKKPCSGYKMKEMTGSGIFTDNGDGAPQSDSAKSGSKTGLRVYQQTLNKISQISFSADGRISPKKPTSIPEVAKQRELSGTLRNDSDSKNKKQISNAKNKELTGHDIFGPPPEIEPRSVAAARTSESRASKDMGEPAPRNLRTSVKVSNPAGGQSNILFSEEPVSKTTKKIHNHKFAELKGNNIFKGDAPPGSAEKPLSVAKLKEMSGSNIFADGKAASRDYLGGVRQPPGGESSISLV
ncbi:hematological/neurological-like protein [Parasponia andersonii]|uniref:Hematological/neurological-like protein n=1 Tax=Parasponia andersonii TaxID=3476 RepID=A0A2P5A6X5_PARAD|nr:hematological/neurological-like protein [Parasponia andersonii]